MRLKRRFVLYLMVAPLLCYGTDFYISPEGKDTDSGLSPDEAWKCIENINTKDLEPGDRLLFQGGRIFAGKITLDKRDNGTISRPILITSYGAGRAVIDGGEKEGLFFDQCEHVLVRDINFKGAGRKNGNTRSGLHLSDVRDVQIDSAEVCGFQKSGIFVENGSDVRVMRVFAHDNGFAGIYVGSDFKKAKNISISFCLAENNPGDPTNKTNHSGNGILMGGVDGGVIEYCAATNNGWDMPREGNGPVGIWAYNSNNVIIQHNISHHNKTSPEGKDGGGFDFDGGMTNSVMQYNFSYNNEGAGFGLYQYSGAGTWKDNVFRYNISVNDGWKNGQCGIHVWAAEGNEETMSDAMIYNNTIVNDLGHAVGYLTDISGLIYRNNIFITGDSQIYGPYQSSCFENNLYWSSGDTGILVDGYRSMEEWSTATGQEMRGNVPLGLEGDPLLVREENEEYPFDPTKLSALAAFKLTPASPCVGTGLFILDNGGRDFWGENLPQNGEKPDIGAHQLTR